MQVRVLVEDRVARSKEGPWGPGHVVCDAQSYHSELTEDWGVPFWSGPSSASPSEGTWHQRRLLRMVREDDARAAVREALRAVAEADLIMA